MHKRNQSHTFEANKKEQEIFIKAEKQGQQNYEQKKRRRNEIINTVVKDIATLQITKSISLGKPKLQNTF